jgi:tetratricopeptide (TPR) repeat protein
MHSDEAESALKYCDALSKIGDSTAELRYNLALLFQETGDAGQAANLYRAALAEIPEFPEALLNLGHALETLGEREEARRCWTEAIRQKPELALDDRGSAA